MMELIELGEWGSLKIEQNNKIIIFLPMYRGTPYLNRQIRRREEERTMDTHMTNLSNIRPVTTTIDFVTEVQSVHINNKKGQMQKQARYTEIQRDNRILLDKISTIMGKTVKKEPHLTRNNRSLNCEVRKRQQLNIEAQNAKMLKRLKEKKPNYEVQKFNQSWKKQKSVIKNLSNYPFLIKQRRPQKKHSSISHMTTYNPNPNTIQLCRMRKIDGVSFLITIRLNQVRLQVIGDTKDNNKDIKIIQVPRDKAVQFIEQECQGRVEGIFQCLRYDGKNEVMYLMANQANARKNGKNNMRNQVMVEKYEVKDNPEFDIVVHLNNDDLQGLDKWKEKKNSTMDLKSPKVQKNGYSNSIEATPQLRLQQTQQIKPQKHKNSQKLVYSIQIQPQNLEYSTEVNKNQSKNIHIHNQTKQGKKLEHQRYQHQHDQEVCSEANQDIQGHCQDQVEENMEQSAVEKEQEKIENHPNHQFAEEQYPAEQYEDSSQHKTPKKQSSKQVPQIQQNKINESLEEPNLIQQSYNDKEHLESNARM